MLFGLFKPQNIFFKIKIHISRNSYVEELEISNDASEKDWLQLGFLVFARLLRLPKSNSSEIANDFVGYQKMKNELNDNKKLIEIITEFLKIRKNTYKKDATLKITCRGQKNRDKFIFTGFTANEEIQCYSYTIFKHIWGNLNDKDKLFFLEGFGVISIARLSNNLTHSLAIELPNSIVRKFD